MRTLRLGDWRAVVTDADPTVQSDPLEREVLKYADGSFEPGPELPRRFWLDLELVASKAPPFGVPEDLVLEAPGQVITGRAFVVSFDPAPLRRVSAEELEAAGCHFLGGDAWFMRVRLDFVGQVDVNSFLGPR